MYINVRRTDRLVPLRVDFVVVVNEQEF